MTPGAYAPSVTQWVAGTPTEDAHGNEVPVYGSRTVKVLAAYPGETLELDNASRDVVTADMVLLLTPDVTTTALDEWTVFSRRYRVDGDPAPFVHPITGTAVTRVSLRRIS